LWRQKAAAKHSTTKLQATPNDMYAIGKSKTARSSVLTSGAALSSLFTEESTKIQEQIKQQPLYLSDINLDEAQSADFIIFS